MRVFPVHFRATACGIVLFWAAAAGQVPPSASDAARALPPPETHYRGREIADFMTFHGASWLVRPERQQQEECTALLTALHLKAGQSVCDLGCGNGFYTFKLARRVGPRGEVFAVDIQPEMLTLLQAELDEKKLENVRPVLGTPADPCLPAGRLDLVLLVDVYHEFGYPEPMLRAIRTSLKPQGRMVLVEFRGEDPLVPIKPLHKMTKEQILAEIPPNGFRLVEQFDKLPWQHVMYFERDETWKGHRVGELHSK